MAKKMKTKSNPKKTASKAPVRKRAVAKGASKYDQTGAPWWKQ